MANEGKPVESIEELRERVPGILKQLNADQQLLQAAAANPILALEELGYEIPRNLRRELDHRIRFRAQERERLKELQSRIHELAGESFDVDEPEALEHVLFKKLKLPPLPAEPVRVPIAAPAATIRTTQVPAEGKPTPQQPVDHAKPTLPVHPLAVRYRVPGTPEQLDVLTALLDKHAVIEPLIAYRKILAGHAPFAPRELYQRIRSGDVPGPLFKLRARLQRARKE